MAYLVLEFIDILQTISLNIRILLVRNMISELMLLYIHLPEMLEFTGREDNWLAADVFVIRIYRK